MNLPRCTCLAGTLLAAVLLVDSNLLSADVAPENAEVQARGPIHEAFAQPLEEVQPKAGPTAPKAPPDPIEENPPEQKPEGEAVQWVPGYWQWDDERGEFLWITGVWRDPPPGRRWMPGSWREVDGAWQWSPGFWVPEQEGELNYLPPPPASVEEGPSVEAPSDDCVYVPGLWVHRDTRYLWRPGYWLRCQPGWVWSPAHYLYTPAGCLFVRGYWDYPLERRGLLFAPVYFAARPRFWTPSFTVSVGFLPGALFVRSGHGHYYYGDYFHDQYRRWGYTSWPNARLAGGAQDPLFGYYRVQNANRTWERDLRGLYADRYAGRGDRLPRTLVQQETIVKDATRGRNKVNIENVTVLRSLSQSAGPQQRLLNVQREERDRQREAAAQLRAAAVQRATAEKQIIVKKEVPSQPQSAPRSVKIDLPKGTSSAAPSGERRRWEGNVERQPRRYEDPSPRIEKSRVDPPVIQQKPKVEAPLIIQQKPKVEAPVIIQQKTRVEAPVIIQQKPKIEAPAIIQQRPASPPPVTRPAPPPQARPAPPPAVKPTQPAPSRSAPAPKPQASKPASSNQKPKR